MASENDCPGAGLPAETRRNVLKGSVAGLAAGLFATSAPALGQARATARAPDIAIPAFASTHELQPLPFKSSSLKGLSKGLIESHWSNNPAATVPLLVIDMYEHSYHMDYGAAAARYIDAFFANIQWDAVSARVEAL